MNNALPIYQLSYRIIDGSNARLPIHEMREEIRAAGERVRNVVSTGWSMFYQFTRPEIASRIVVDAVLGEEIEAVETDLREHGQTQGRHSDMWRITADGRATLIRPYREDSAEDPNLARRGLTPGKWLSPGTLVREVYELATHAKELAKAFPDAQGVEFYCTWQGLKGRKIGDFDFGVDWDERVSHVDQRTSTQSFSIEELSADTAGVAARLSEPVLRLFDGLELSREWVLRQVPRYRMV